MPAHESASNPAPCGYNGALHLVHRGYGSGDQNLWATSFIAGKGWEPDQKFPGHLSGAGPALIVYRDENAESDRLLCVPGRRGSRGWAR
ncbi:hypothetical protein [Kitasatospora sp. NBC_01266]|uniref:hypothetical protein n=1 Tax=Kitasatospora sp. NBC_01266 TaxID=2903572 RepID=UPI002E31C38B|nr:hypothetical protein [Kitasatospora sp. NBC_01266]